MSEMDARPPTRCRSNWAKMRCELAAGHLTENPPRPHAHEQWRWNSKIQWTAPTLPIRA